ncbi:MAG: error-prone DNA polymerase [Planctomycetota bacterium]
MASTTDPRKKASPETGSTASIARDIANSPSGRRFSPGAEKEKLRQREWKRLPGRGQGPAYVELRAASAFSFLEGASDPEDLIERAAALGLPAIALTDRNGVYGAPRLHKAAEAAGLRALVGAEVVLEEPRPKVQKKGAPEVPPARLTLLVENRTGYRNLCRLLTTAARWRTKGDARATWNHVAQHTEGLHCLTGGDEGPLANALRRGGLAGGRRLLDRLTTLFGDRVHLELQRHHRREQEHRNRAVLELARERRLLPIATNGVRFANEKDRELFDVLTCIRHGVRLDGAGRLLDVNRERRIKSPAEMATLFADVPNALQGTVALADRLTFTLSDLGYRFPDYPLPPGETPSTFLRRITWNEARARFRPLTAKAQDQLEKELTVIERLGLEGYFLIVWDLIQFCQREGILVQGRGSAANSAVCYALSITAIDPVKMGLLFERFLSEERGEWPDIDLDLPSGEQREKVIQYVYRRYGPHGAAMTANVITYRERSSAREVAKVLGYSPEQVDRLSRALSRRSGWEQENPSDDVIAGIVEAGLDPEDPRVDHFGRLWQRIQNRPRHLGQHSGGMVMAAGRLDEVVPLEPASMPGRVVVQWDKDDCADLGIIKVDLLGLGMLAALEEAVPLIRAKEHVHLDLAHLPPDDPKTYEMIRAADTVGVFQIESRAQMASLPRNAPERFYDLVVQVAIIRPGPIVGGMVHPFFERRRGRLPVEYPHPSLEPILERTLGVPLFQEQILRVAMVAAGFTGGEAEELRRAMGFKRSVERMEVIERRLREGMKERGIVGETQEAIVKSITSFALYGFPESHAASFALIAYASAYLKAHHPAAFYVSLLNAWPMGFYHPSTLVQDARRHGIEARPICVQRSGWKCRWEDGAIRIGLCFVRGLRQESGEAIEAEQARGTFQEPEELARRAALRGDELDALARVGALAGLGLTRREALWQVAEVGKEPGPLYEGKGKKERSPLREMSKVEETLSDYQEGQLTTGEHLMSHVRGRLEAHGITPLGKVSPRLAGRRIKMAGAVIVRQRPSTAKGFLFLTLEDETGMAQAIVRPKLLEQYRGLINGSPGLVVEGLVQELDGSVSVKAERMWTLEDFSTRMPSHDYH